MSAHPAPTAGRNPSRRDLLRTGGAALVAGASVPLFAGAKAHGARAQERTAVPPMHPGGSGVLRVGLVGCGGRGTGAALNALRADPQVEVVAIGDAFADHAQDCLDTLNAQGDVAERVRVDEDHVFVGWGAYRGVIESSDVVLLATSPHFRPLHVAAAVAAGKHLFVEKPVATDVPGLRAMRAACERAAKQGLSVVSGLCYRYSHAKRETVQRIHEGAVGDIVAVQTTYNTGGLWLRERRPGWSEMEYQMRNWLYFTWLSGDHIAEQHVHSLDKLAWVLGDRWPTRCTASGGRTVRTQPEYGNVYDHFNTVFEYEGGLRAFSSCRQWPGAPSSDVSDHVLGTKGNAELQSHTIRGEERWRWRNDEPDDMYQNELDELFAAIRSGERRDDSGYMIGSTMMAIMARMSAYTGETITWDQAWSSTLDLSPAAYEWGPIETREVARPGITRFS